MAKETTTYQCYACGQYLEYDTEKGYYICPHCGTIQFGTPIQRFGEETES